VLFRCFHAVHLAFLVDIALILKGYVIHEIISINL
jgi:hypothetical protein